MNFEQVNQLGKKIRQAYRARHCNEKDLPIIASEFLSKEAFEFEFDISRIADFILETTITQQPGLAFSDLPIVLYKCDEFYIEMLIWTNSTTTIHQHAFSGALRVMKGSSFHSTWSFEEKRRLSSRFLIGDCKFENAEVLREGDIRQIISGRAGLVHALFHLDQPSVTLVVRNRNEPWAEPQYSLDLPHVAISSSELQRDSIVRLYSRLLAVADRIDGADPQQLFARWCEELDFPRLYYLTRLNAHRFSEQADKSSLLETVEKSHPGLSKEIGHLLTSKERLDSLVQARSRITDHDARFFLALLLNLPSRKAIVRVIREQYPDRDPGEFLISVIKTLKAAKSGRDAFFEMARQAQLGNHLLANRVAAALPFDDHDPLLARTLDQLLSKDGALQEQRSTEVSDDEDKMIQEAIKKLNEITELRPLTS